MQLTTLDKEILGALISLAAMTYDTPPTLSTNFMVLSALKQLGNGNKQLLDEISYQKQILNPSCFACISPCGKTDNFDFEVLAKSSIEIQTLKYEYIDILSEISLRKLDNINFEMIYKTLFYIGNEWNINSLIEHKNAILPLETL